MFFLVAPVEGVRSLGTLCHDKELGPSVRALIRSHRVIDMEVVAGACDPPPRAVES